MRLYDTAGQQGGHFTARQAREAGYEDNTHPHHVRTGHWIREHRGIYRLAQFPLPARADLILWQLWSHNRSGEPQGTFSHGTALAIHELSDAMPSKLDMTVPPGFQRMAAIPGVLRIRRAQVTARDIDTVEGVRVTTPLRTLIDVIVDDAIAPDLQIQAVDQAIRRGLVMRRQLDATKVSTRGRRRIDRVLKQVPDGRSTSVRHSRRVSRGARNPAPRTIAS